MGRLKQYITLAGMLLCIWVSSLGVPGLVNPAFGVTEVKAIFAGGCFWCLEHPFDELDGVISTTAGYTGGTKEEPSYQQVSLGNTGHAEAVEVIYDSNKISYPELLATFWQNVDPMDPKGQFCDKGNQYRSSIFYTSEAQRKLAEQSKLTLDNSGRFEKPIATKIEAAGAFYAAEDYHQDYYLKNPIRYKIYRFGCGRDQRLAEIWGTDQKKISDLTTLQKYFGEIDREEDQVAQEPQEDFDDE